MFLIRHGRQNSKLCNVDVSLDLAGQKQALLLANRLAGYGIDKIYSSDLKRARETAQIIGDVLELECEIMDELREIDFGDLTGKEDYVIRTEYAQFQEERARQDSDLPYPGGENGADVIRRVLPCWQKIVEAPSKRSVIVTHGGVIRTLCAYLTETNLKNKLKFAIDLENTSITHVTYDERRDIYYIERFNDFAHLEQYPELLRHGWKSSLMSQ